MRISAATLLTVLVCLLASVAFKDKGNELFERIDAYLGQMEEQGQSGQVLVSVKGEVYSRGFGKANRETGEAFTPQTITGTGSITKQFTAAAILKLQEEGKLRTTDLLSKYIQDIPADKQSITLHHLLTHTAGFPGAIGDDYAPITSEEFIDLAMNTPLRQPPGQAYEYSNVGYSLLAILVEQLSGMTYEQYLADRLFAPAGMERTGYVLPDFVNEKLAVGYRGDKVWGKLNEKNWNEEGPYWHLKGNGGILSNAEEMQKWHEALQTEKVLSEASKAAMFQKHIREGADAPSHYGYGWAVFDTPRGTQLVTHNGGNGIFMADYLRYPKEDVMIWFATNAVNKSNRDTGWEIARMVFQPGYQAEFKTKNATGPLTKTDEAIREAFLEMVNSEGEESARGFVSARFAQGLIDMAPMEQHVAMMQRLRGDLGEGKLAQSWRMDDTLVLAFETAQGLLEVHIALNNDRIAGFSVEN